MSEITPKYIIDLERLRVRLLEVANRYSIYGIKLSNEATLEEITHRLENLDGYGNLNLFLGNQPYSIIDKDGEIKSNLQNYRFYRDQFIKEIDLPNITGELSTIENPFNCPKLEKVRLGCTSASTAGAFAYCDSLASVSLPNVTKVNQSNFVKSCPAMKVFVLGNQNSGGLTFSGSSGYQFSAGCTEGIFQAVVLPSKVKATYYANFYKGIIYLNSIKLYVPASIIEEYKADSGWKQLDDAGRLLTIEDNMEFLLSLGADLEDYELEVSE